MNRDFLFGVIAVQLGQATAGQVMAAASAYFADTSRSIPERLVADGTVDAGRVKMIEDVVAAMLDAHDGDAKDTLQTVGGDQALYASFGGSIAVDEVSGDVTIVAAPEEIAQEGEVGKVALEQPGRYSLKGGSPAAAEIGRGGIGRVLVAFDEHLGREIAIKELLAAADGSAVSTPKTDRISRTGAIAARFLREARVTGQLEHPNIVPVYEVGQRDSGAYYYTMKLVRGRTLSEALKGCATLADRLKLLHHFVDLCHAVAYAHSRGVVHRDLKAENVMLGEFGETVVVDWGLAKVEGKQDIRGGEIEREMSLLHDAATGKTVDGTAIGTPAYMSPEQADGRIDAIDERSDIWSLGAVLYELLTGKPPFEGVSPYEIIGKVLQDEVVPPREKSGEIPAELSAVAMKALTRDKAARYEKAEQLADEINAFMSGGRIAAYEYSTFELIKAFVTRHKAASFFAALVLAVAVVAAVFLYGANQTAEAERDRAEEQRSAAVEQEREATANLAQAHVASAQRYIDDHDYGPAYVYAAAGLREYQRAGLPLEGDEKVALESVLHRAKAMRMLELEHTWPGPEAELVTSVLSPDGKLLACFDMKYRLWIYTLDGSAEPRQVTLPGFAVGMRFTEDGTRLAVAYYRGALRTHDVATLAPSEPTQLFDGVIRMARFAPDGKRVAVYRADGIAFLVQRGSSDPPVRLGPAQFYTWSPDGKLLVRSHPDEGVVFHDGVTGEIRAAVDVGEGNIGYLSFSCDGTRLLANTASGFRVLDTATREELGQTPSLDYAVFSSACFEDGWLLGVNDGVLFRDGLASRETTLWQSPGSAQVVAGKGGRVAVAQPSGVRSWRARTEGRAWLLPTAKHPHVASFSTDGARAAVVTVGGLLYQLDMSPSPRLTRLASLKDTMLADTTISPDGTRIATANAANVVSLFDTRTGARIDSERLSELGWQAELSPPVEFTPDGERLLVAVPDGRLHVLDGQTLALERTLSVVSYIPKALAPSADGELMLMGDYAGKLTAWDADTLRMWHVKDTEPVLISDIETTPDGRVVLTAGKDGWVRRFEMQGQNWRPLEAFEAHHAWVNSLAISPDGKLLLTTSDDHAAKIWDLTSGELVREFGTVAQVAAAEFTPDGLYIAVGDGFSLLLLPDLRGLAERDGAALYEEASRVTGLGLDGSTVAALGEARETRKAATPEEKAIGPRQWQVHAADSENTQGRLPEGTTVELLGASDHKPFSPRVISTLDEDNKALFDLPDGVDAFVTVVEADGRRTYNQVSTYGPGQRDSAYNISEAKVDRFAKLVGAEMPPGTGAAFGWAWWEQSDDYTTVVPVGCATLTVDGGARAYYTTPWLRTPARPSLELEATHPASGGFYIFGLEPGVHKITVRVGDAVIERDVIIHAGSVTLASLTYPHEQFPEDPTPLRCMWGWKPPAAE